MTATLRLVRVKAGCGPERSRVVHLIRDDDPRLRTLCGLYMIPGSFDRLSGVAGMPCEPCAINSPGPDDLEIAAGVS